MSEANSYNEIPPTEGSDWLQPRVRPPLVAVADRRNREPRWLLALTLSFLILVTLPRWLLAFTLSFVILVILLFAVYVRLPSLGP
jgi:hypothetical protein